MEQNLSHFPLKEYSFQSPDKSCYDTLNDVLTLPLNEGNPIIVAYYC